MGGFKLIIEKRDGTKIWINPAYIIKMEKDLNDNYFMSKRLTESPILSPQFHKMFHLRASFIYTPIQMVSTS